MNELKKWHLSKDRLTVLEGRKKIATFYEVEQAETYANDHNRMWVTFQPLTKKEIKIRDRQDLSDRAFQNWESLKINTFGVRYTSTQNLFNQLIKRMKDKDQRAVIRKYYKEIAKRPPVERKEGVFHFDPLEYLLTPHHNQGHSITSHSFDRKLPKI